MNLGEILNGIWNLPWYKVLIVAAADDVIFLLKVWPVYILAILIVISVSWKS